MLNHFTPVQLVRDPMECSPPGSSVHGILQARMLEWVAVPSSRWSSQPRDWTRISYVSRIAGGFFTTEPLWKPRVGGRNSQHRDSGTHATGSGSSQHVSSGTEASNLAMIPWSISKLRYGGNGSPSGCCSYILVLHQSPTTYTQNTLFEQWPQSLMGKDASP